MSINVLDPENWMKLPVHLRENITKTVHHKIKKAALNACASRLEEIKAESGLADKILYIIERGAPIIPNEQRKELGDAAYWPVIVPMDKPLEEYPFRVDQAISAKIDLAKATKLNKNDDMFGMIYANETAFLIYISLQEHYQEAEMERIAEENARLNAPVEIVSTS